MELLPKLIVIGGSWGGIQAALHILQNLPANYKIPIVLVLHQLRNNEGTLPEIFSKRLKLQVCEIEDKMLLTSGTVYIAPSNYHVLVENDLSLSLDDSELENHSRPSIDITFSSAASVVGDQVIGILLSGANKDGSAGLKEIAERGGKVIVQDPREAQVNTMPLAAVSAVPDCSVMDIQAIFTFLRSLHVN